MKCRLTHSKKGKPIRVELEFDNGVITESTYTGTRGNPRSVQIPKGLYGDDPKLFIGRRMLELASQGFEFQQEDEALSRDRVLLTVSLEDDLLSLLTAQFVESAQQLTDMKDRSVLSKGMLLGLQASPGGKMFLISFLRSGLDKTQATLLALAYRCTNGSAVAADFLGQTIDLPGLVKPLRDFDSLDESVLDRFDAQGITLRIVDYRKIQPAAAGFVGF